MSDNELRISIDKPAGVELSTEMAAALENLAQVIADENDDEVSGFQWKNEPKGPKQSGLPDIGRVGNLGFGKVEQNLTVCTGGYQDGACGGWFVEW